MSYRLTHLISLSAVLAYFFLSGCASVGSQPPSYVEDPKAKAQEPCQAQGTQDKTAKEPCKKAKP